MSHLRRFREISVARVDAGRLVGGNLPTAAARAACQAPRRAVLCRHETCTYCPCPFRRADHCCGGASETAHRWRGGRRHRSARCAAKDAGKCAASVGGSVLPRGRKAGRNPACAGNCALYHHPAAPCACRKSAAHPVAAYAWPFALDAGCDLGAEIPWQTLGRYGAGRCGNMVPSLSRRVRRAAAGVLGWFFINASQT